MLIGGSECSFATTSDGRPESSGIATSTIDPPSPVASASQAVCTSQAGCRRGAALLYGDLRGWRVLCRFAQTPQGGSATTGAGSAAPSPPGLQGRTVGSAGAAIGLRS